MTMVALASGWRRGYSSAPAGAGDAARDRPRHRDHRPRPGPGPPPGGGRRPWSWSTICRPAGPSTATSTRARHARGGVPRARAQRRVPARLPGLRRGGRRRCWSSSQDSRLVIHNAAFDIRFLNAELGRTAASRWPSAAPSTRCCWRSAASRAPPNSLDALCRRFAVDNSARTLHGALLDCELLAEVYLHLIGGRQIGLGLDAPGQRGAGGGMQPHRPPAARRTRPRPRSWRRMRPSSPSSTTRSGCD